MKRNTTTQFEVINDNACNIVNQNLGIDDNTAKIEFITGSGGCLSGNLYDTATIKVTMGRFMPTRKFLNEIAETLAADMIDYVKTGGSANKITANLVYGEEEKYYESNL